MPPDYTNLLQLTMANEGLLKDWVRQRPSITKTYDDLLADVRAGNIKQQVHSEDSWKKETGKHDAHKNVGAFYRGSGLPVGDPWGAGEIHYPEGGEGSLPHEILHYFAGHQARDRGNPEKINPYIKADMALGGWLPSFHPAGRRPTLPGDNRFSNWWNENRATQQTEYSNDPKSTGTPFWNRDDEHWTGGTRAYHPWFDEHAYDTTADKMKENVLKYISDKESISEKPTKTKKFKSFISKVARPFKESPSPLSSAWSTSSRPSTLQGPSNVPGPSIPMGPLRHDKNMYPIYPKQSTKAQSFRDAFRDARKEGLDIFDWENRKYTTELA